jgi:hypothetical protein
MKTVKITYTITGTDKEVKQVIADVKSEMGMMPSEITIRAKTHPIVSQQDLEKVFA